MNSGGQNLEEVLDLRLAELQKENNYTSLLNHAKVKELAQKMHETLNPGKIVTHDLEVCRATGRIC